MDELTEAELGYLAGLIDGEGCINIACNRGRYYILQVIVAQTNEHLLDYWQKKTGLGTIHHVKRGRNENANERWTWNMSSSVSQKLLEMIKPYLVLKREEAETALEFLRVCKYQERQYRGKGAKRITRDMLLIREAYKNALHELKRQRGGAELERNLSIDFVVPESPQMTMFGPIKP